MLSAVPTRRELLIWLVAILVGATVIVSLRSDPAGAGAGPPPAPTTFTVYIATGENYPDALGAAAAAGVDLAPVLLVQQNAIPQATLDELNRLEPSEIVIVGGEAVVSAGVENDLVSLSFVPHVTRVSGANRYETAADLSLATFPTSGKYPRLASVVDTAIGGMGAEVTDLLDTTIEAPDYGYLIVDGGADFAYGAASAIVQCWITLDAAPLNGSHRFSDLDATSTEDDCVTNVATEVSPGQHTIAFRVSSDAGVDVEVGSLTVLWVPFGRFGQTPYP